MIALDLSENKLLEIEMWRISSLLALFLSGCAVYPLPEQSTGIDTTTIITKIRCQMGRAVRGTAISFIRKFDQEIVYPGLTGRQLADEIEFGGVDYTQLNRNLIIEKIRTTFVYYDQAKVGFDFDIDSKEENVQSTGGNVVRKFLRRVDTLALLGENDLTRQVQRNFRVVDEFRLLGSDKFAHQCKPVLDNISVNIEYPMSGELPFENLVKSFVNANEWQNLQGDDKEPKIPKMADTIMFTTKISANADPSSAFNAIGRGILPSTLTFKIDNTRTDYHKLIVAITVPEKKTLVMRGGTTTVVSLSKEAAVSLALDEQRERNVQNAIVKIGDSLSKFAN